MQSNQRINCGKAVRQLSDDTQATKQSKQTRSTDKSNISAACDFDALPNSAFVRLVVVLALLSCAKPTLYRWIKESKVPAPVKFTARFSAWQVGELRACLRAMHESRAQNGANGGQS